MMVERRKYPRYRMKYGEIVIVGRETNTLAFVRNASPGGLQLEYFSAARGEDCQWRLVDLMAGLQCGWSVANLCCNVVYDMKAIVENGSFTGLDVRHCGLCFESITDLQEKNIQLLLEKHRQQP